MGPAVGGEWDRQWQEPPSEAPSRWGLSERLWAPDSPQSSRNTHKPPKLQDRSSGLREATPAEHPQTNCFKNRPEGALEGLDREPALGGCLLAPLPAFPGLAEASAGRKPRPQQPRARGPLELQRVSAPALGSSSHFLTRSLLPAAPRRWRLCSPHCTGERIKKLAQSHCSLEGKGTKHPTHYSVVTVEIGLVHAQ